MLGYSGEVGGMAEQLIFYGEGFEGLQLGWEGGVYGGGAESGKDIGGGGTVEVVRSRFEVGG
jgi:hypothetical protein